MYKCGNFSMNFTHSLSVSDCIKTSLLAHLHDIARSNADGFKSIEAKNAASRQRCNARHTNFLKAACFDGGELAGYTRITSSHSNEEIKALRQ